MKIPIIKYSALEYWLDGTDRYYYLIPESHTIEKNFHFKIDDENVANLAKAYNLSLPLNIMVPENKNRNGSEKALFFKWIKSIPENSFFRMKDWQNNDENIYVCCPELTFCFVASVFSLAETVLLGNMLCATYVFDNDYNLKQRDREPVTTVRKIKRYLEKLGTVKGVRKAKIAANYIVDNCNSPREAAIAAMAALPIKHGGYGMPLFEMNGKVYVKNEYVAGLGRQVLRCDIVWTKEKVVVEYESDMTHLEKEQHRYDKRRSTALIGSGYKVIYLTNSDVNLFSKMDDTFFMIRKSLHLRRNQKEFQTYLDVRYEAYNIIFRKNYFKNLCDNKYLAHPNF